MTHCTICNTVLDGEFCKNCGQQNTQKKLDIKSFFSDLSSNVFDLDQSLFYNIYYILRFPKKVIENYWAGFRNYYYNPGKVLFYFLTLSGLSSYILRNSLLGIDINVPDVVSTQFIFILIIYPIFILTSYLTYRKNHRTIIEHATASIYIVSTIGIVLLVFQSIFTYYKITHTRNSVWLPILLILVTIWNSFIYTRNKKLIYKILNPLTEILIFIIVIFIILLISHFTGILNIGNS
ncbi:MAG: hypothetical protein AB7O47_01565 [Flavobacteriales bacterium]